MTVDLLAELEAIREKARRGQLQLARGHGVTGVTALRSIEKRAEDALRFAEQQQPDRNGSAA